MPKSAPVDAKIGEALRRRCYPNTGLHPKQLAHVCGVSLSTFLRWWRGESRITGQALGNLMVFFAQQRDWAFVNEVTGLDVTTRTLDARLEQLDRDLAELRSDLKGNGDAGLARTRDAEVVDLAGRDRGPEGQAVARQEKALALSRTGAGE